METKSHPERTDERMVSIEIDQKQYTIPKGYTLATAITYSKGIAYRTTTSGSRRGPVCNMGVCFECSAFVEGKGYVRTCMLEIEDGMVVSTQLHAEQMPSHSKNHKSDSNDTNDISHFDVAIIGSGPAGMAAAEELANNGLDIVIIDEQENIGGQIYRHVPESIRSYSPNELVSRVEQSRSIHWRLGNTAWAIVPYSQYGTIDNSQEDVAYYQIYLEYNKEISAKRIIIATGAYDYMIPFKGWTNPGVMSAGGLQVFAKTQNFLPGDNVFLTGSHPFLLIVAKEIIESGGTVKGIAFSQSFPKIKEIFKHGLNLSAIWSKSNELIQSIRSIRKAKVPVMFNRVPIEVEDTEDGKVVHLQQINKNGALSTQPPKEISCDIVGACYGFLTSTELPKQLGCSMAYDEKMGGHVVNVNGSMKSSVNNVYVVGELTGVGGAELSEVEGRIAGLSILDELDIKRTHEQQRKYKGLMKKRKSWTSFAKMLGEMTAVKFDLFQLLQNKPKTIVCRCEEVNFDEINNLLQKHPHISSMNALKLLSRCGMGLCQGRYCEGTLLKISERLLSDNFTHDFFSERYPSKSVTINDIVNGGK